jgi:peptide/nickel transport system substrate-binding protein
VYYVAFKNVGAGIGTPLEDARVRRALNLGTDRFGIVRAIFDGFANVAPSFVLEGNLGFDPEAMTPFPYDPDAARVLLAEAGYPDGFEIVMGCPADGYVNINEVCQAVAQSLAAIGVDVDIDFQTTNAYWSEPQYAVTGPMYVDSWSSDVGEALPRLQGALVPGAYYTGWEDAGFAALVDAITTEVDRDARARLYREMHEAMTEDPPFLYLYQPVIFEAVNVRVQGYQPFPAEEYFLRTVSLSD